jgi:hypothetical protein
MESLKLGRSDDDEKIDHQFSTLRLIQTAEVALKSSSELVISNNRD